MTFIPFDADEAEIAALEVLRDGVPEGMRAPLWGWIAEQIEWNSGYAHLNVVHDVQSALQVQLNAPYSGLVETRSVISAVAVLDQKMQLRVADYLLSRTTAGPATQLKRILAANVSALDVVFQEASGQYRLATRTPDGVVAAVQSAISINAQAGSLLATAWNFAYGVDPKPTQAMDAAVRAVETLAIATIVPVKHRPKATLGDAIGTLKANGDWTHGLRELDKKAPANEAIYDMLQTLWAGQQYRHVHPEAAPPTIEQARTHVQLAATLVAWLASGEIKRVTPGAASA